MATLQGTLKTLDMREGGTNPKFGFVKDDNGTDRFFPGSALLDGLQLMDLHIGDRLEFEPTTHAKGERAARVRRANNGHMPTQVHVQVAAWTS